MGAGTLAMGIPLWLLAKGFAIGMNIFPVLADTLTHKYLSTRYRNPLLRVSNVCVTPIKNYQFFSRKILLLLVCVFVADYFFFSNMLRLKKKNVKFFQSKTSLEKNLSKVLIFCYS